MSEFKFTADSHNGKLERAELEAWRDKPAHFVAYVVKGDVTTWPGHVIGQVIRRNVYRGTFGRMESVRIRGTNGVEYYGRKSADWSECIKLHAAK